MGIFIGLMAFGILLIAGPIGLAAADIKLGGVATLVMIVSGIILTVLSTILMVITKLYVKTRADEAFVRTGLGGMKVVQDGGALVIPVIHQIVQITLRTIKLEVKREGKDALLTKDKLRADLAGEFFVRVKPDDKSIQQAARSFGEKMLERDYVKALVEDKLVSALRSVAATKTLEELNTDREAFMAEVTKNITNDLQENGLFLETATISQLDQTDQQWLKEGNIFDAQGLRTIAEITQDQLTRKNELVRNGERARTQQDVETRKQVLALEQDKAEAEARQAAEIAKVQALQDQEAKQKAIEAQREVQVTELARQRAVEVADQEKQQAVQVANEAREQAAAVAAKQKEQAVVKAQRDVEVEQRAKEKAIAEAQQEQTAAEAELAKQEALREAERQSIKTVEITKTAERDKERQIIAAQAKAEQEYLEKQRAADAKAYEIEKEAQGRKAAADADAEAVLKKAKAESDAKKLAAEAEAKLQMVPVQVKAGEVDVEQKRVNVLQQELEARAKSGQVAQDFELAKLRIEQQAHVQIAYANAVGQFGAKFETQLFGTPEDVANMTAKLFDGMGKAQLVNGFVDQIDETAKQAIAAAAGKAGDLVGAVASRLSGNGQKGEAKAAKSDTDSE